MLKTLDLAGSIFFALRRKRPAPENCNKVLIAKIDHLGDVIMSLHVLPALKKALPHAEIHFVCGSWSRAIVEKNPLIDRVITFDDFRLNRKGSKWARIKRTVVDALALIRTMRKERYDLAVDFRAYYPNLIPALFLGKAKCLLGYRTGGFGFMLDRSTKWREGIHETTHFFELLSGAVPSLKRQAIDLAYLTDDFQTERFLERHGTNGKPYVVVHAFCHGSFLNKQKHWKIEEWNRVIRHLEKEGYRVLCTGDSNDAPLIDQAVQGTSALNVAAVTPLPVLAGLIQRSDLVLCVDTFVSHLAGALGAKTIVIFNDVEPVEQWRPWGETVVTAPIESSSSDIIERIRQFAGKEQMAGHV